MHNAKALIPEADDAIPELCGKVFLVLIVNLNSFKKDINSKNNKSLVKKLIQTKKVRSKIIKLKQDINKPDFGRN